MCTASLMCLRSVMYKETLIYIGSKCIDMIMSIEKYEWQGHIQFTNRLYFDIFKSVTSVVIFFPRHGCTLHCNLREYILLHNTVSISLKYSIQSYSKYTLLNYTFMTLLCYTNQNLCFLECHLWKKVDIGFQCLCGTGIKS